MTHDSWLMTHASMDVLLFCILCAVPNTQVHSPRHCIRSECVQYCQIHIWSSNTSFFAFQLNEMWNKILLNTIMTAANMCCLWKKIDAIAWTWGCGSSKWRIQIEAKMAIVNGGCRWVSMVVPTVRGSTVSVKQVWPAWNGWRYKKRAKGIDGFVIACKLCTLKRKQHIDLYYIVK